MATNIEDLLAKEEWNFDELKKVIVYLVDNYRKNKLFKSALSKFGETTKEISPVLFERIVKGDKGSVSLLRKMHNQIFIDVKKSIKSDFESITEYN